MDQEPRQLTVFDAERQQLGDVYAKALLSFAQQNGNLDEMIDQLDSVIGVFNELPQFKATLESPRIGVDQKMSLIDKSFAGKVDSNLVNFLKIVGSKGRFDCLNAISGAAHRIHDEMSGRVQASLTTAQEIDETVRQKVAARLSEVLGKTVVVTSSVDADIIGGMIVRVGDTVYDGSVVNQLDQVRTRALKTTTDAIRASLDKFTS